MRPSVEQLGVAGEAERSAVGQTWRWAEEVDPLVQVLLQDALDVAILAGTVIPGSGGGSQYPAPAIVCRYPLTGYRIANTPRADAMLGAKKMTRTHKRIRATISFSQTST